MENKKISDYSEEVQIKINEILELVNKMPMDTKEKREAIAKKLIEIHITDKEEDKYEEPQGPECI